jgi:hypothetical protein
MTDRQRKLTQKRKVGEAYQKGLKESKLPHVTVTVHPNGQTVVRSTMSKEQAIAVLIAVVARYTPTPVEATAEDEDGGYAIEEAKDVVLALADRS